MSMKEHVDLLVESQGPKVRRCILLWQIYEIFFPSMKCASQPEKVLYWLRELLSGLLFLEKNCVVHRDLKMENLLLSQDGKLVIGDFGKAILLDDTFKIPYVQGIMIFNNRPTI